MKKLFFITTAIDYVNAAPHIGHALEKIQADVIARFRRFLGEEVLFLTGTDENSLKSVQAAEKEGISTKELVDRNAKKFHQLKESLGLSFDDFIRTTEPRHIKGAQKLWQACEKDIYKKKYQGLYCVGCEEFYKEEELINGLCPEHQAKPVLIEEENYFFKLSRYQKELKKIIEKDEVKIIPQTRKNEVLSFINSGLQDFCVSRAAERGRGWGIPVPNDSSQIQWTWFDALSNYINAVGYEGDEAKFEKWWQKNENKLHVIGKGILRFHAVYWLAMLLSAKLSLPKTIFVHGYITSAGQKMSKSLGNVLNPLDLVEKYGADSVRYYLLREIPAFDDGDITEEKVRKRYNADLAGGIGNLVARVTTLATKLKVQNAKSKTTAQNAKLKKEIDKTWENYKKALEDFRFNEALATVWGLIAFCDKYIEETRPWEKSSRQEEVIKDLLSVISSIADLLQITLPQTSQKIQEQLKTGKTSLLFPRLA